MVEVRPDCVGPGEFVGVVVLAGGVGLLGVELLLVLLLGNQSWTDDS